MSYNDIKKRVVFDILDKYPDAANMTLARILYRDHPEFFKDLDAARSVIRLYRGARGQRLRKEIKNQKYYR